MVSDEEEKHSVLDFFTECIYDEKYWLNDKSLMEEIEMRLFRDKLQQLVPIIEKKNNVDNEGNVTKYAYTDGIWDKKFYSIPYLKDIERLYESNWSIEGKRIFLITENVKVAMKVALGILQYPFSKAIDDMEEENGRVIGENQCLDDKSTDERNLKLRLISTKIRFMHELEDAIGSVESEDNVFFMNVRRNIDRENIMDLIKGCIASVQFVVISPEFIEEPWVMELMMDRECEIIKIPTVHRRYYVDIISNLLNGESYRLEEGLSLERILINMQKKHGTNFGEEHMAWILDQAVKCASMDKRYVLKTEDFIFNKSDITSSMRMMERMIGLKNVKNVMLEYAALRQEQIRNNRLVNMCTSVIFIGNPGIGKKECAKVFAQIMAEYGQNTGGFVLAGKTDIIGCYLGHTALKVEELFEQSRDGVLFVDEAGFFVSDDRKEFVQEAIKEFVRCMEQYRSVTVIFALYPYEVEKWMQLDKGLSSCISRIVEFQDYSEDEMVRIAKLICEEQGYNMGSNVEAIIKKYILDQKRYLKDKFANVREIQKLVEFAIISKSLNSFKDETENYILEEQNAILEKEDFESAVYRLQGEHEEQR